jgi:redox-sensitive bicupin YhaK (pirin superfamily)
MVPQSKGKIFLSEERGLHQMDWFRTHSTFNFGQYNNEHKMSFGALYVLNEDTLAGGKRLTMQVEEGSDVILLPIVGAINFKNSEGQDGMLIAGQVQVLHMPPNATVEISNPYEASLVKFLQLWIRTPATINSSPSFSFDLEANRNQLIEIFRRGDIAGVPYSTGVIAKFAGREETVYKVKHPGNGVFAFAIEGELEVQYRLMQAGDGLALWDMEEIEMEALSNNAIILIVEIPVD